MTTTEATKPHHYVETPCKVGTGTTCKVCGRDLVAMIHAPAAKQNRPRR